MTSTSYDKHLKYFKYTYDILKKPQSDPYIRHTISKLMAYLVENHLIDKHYLMHNHLFVKCEANQVLLNDVSAEILLSFLTMIYRIDFIDANSDAYMIYYKNQMILNIIRLLIIKLNDY